MSPWVVPRTHRPAEGIRLKTWQEIRMMREAGRIVAEVCLLYTSDAADE